MSRAADLTPNTLLQAYAKGYFPMPDQNREGEVLWYRPDPRAIIPLDGFHVSRSLSRTLKRKTFVSTFNKAFEQVMKACANRPETWITGDFVRAYGELHRLGFAHSVEVWRNGDPKTGELVGGVYGVAIGGAFFAESMFHLATDASKVALHGLVSQLNRCGFLILEVQFLTDHLVSLGAVNITDEEYTAKLDMALDTPCIFRCEPLDQARN